MEEAVATSAVTPAVFPESIRCRDSAAALRALAPPSDAAPARRPAVRAISLDAAVAMSKWSRRTWWRRIASGEARRVGDDGRGRVMLAWERVAACLPVPLEARDVGTMLRADAGDRGAQNDFGQRLLSLGRPVAAVYWIRLAAEQGCADAMQWLGQAYATGEGVERNDYLALMWIARAAAQGHAIARAQADGLLGRSVPSGTGAAA